MSGFFTAPRIAHGPGAIEQLGALGLSRVALIVDPAVGESERTLRLREELAKSAARVERLATPAGEPTVASVETVATQLTALGPDGIVAVGGGSTLDLAKGAWVRSLHPVLPLVLFTPLTEVRLRVRARLVAVPTTAGSGSEATGSAYFHRPHQGLLEIATRELEPDWAILDPYFLTTLGPRSLALGGADALAHALDAIASEWSTPFTDALAREAIGLVVRELPRAVKRPDELEALGRLQCAAAMAGLAVANAQLGAGHALAHAVSAVTGLAHAAAVAVFLASVAEFNYPSARERFAGLQAAIGPGPLQSAPAFGGRWRALGEQVGLPRTLVEAGVDPARLLAHRDRILDLASASPSLLGNPRLPSRAELAEILRGASGVPMPPAT